VGHGGEELRRQIVYDRRMRASVAVVVVALLVVGCVKKSTHEKALGRIAELEGQVRDRDKQIADAKSAHDKQLAESGEKLTQAQNEKAATEAELAEVRAMREADEKRLAAYKALQDRFKSLVDAGDLEIAFRNGQMTLKLPSGVLFPSGSADLSEKGKKTLTTVTKLLMDFKGRRFLVAGHTDNVPIKTEKFANNWYLSTARAVSVVEFMIAQGFDGDQLAAAGYGHNDPVASNKSGKGRLRNRRIEIILVPDLTELPKLSKEPTG
jgi:chemotaxis protein MotB